jgi:hypothetical protein
MLGNVDPVDNYVGKTLPLCNNGRPFMHRLHSIVHHLVLLNGHQVSL